MPHARNGDNFFFRHDFVNDPIRTENNFTDRLVIFLRHNPAELWELRQHVNLGHEQTAKRFSHGRVILGNKQHDGLQIVAPVPTRLF